MTARTFSKRYAGGGELFDLVETRTVGSPDEMRPVVAQLAQGLAFLHTPGVECNSGTRGEVAHLDLKLENVLVTCN